MNEFIGILPAAGLGSRLQPFRYAKESWWCRKLLKVREGVDLRKRG